MTVTPSVLGWVKAMLHPIYDQPDTDAVQQSEARGVPATNRADMQTQGRQGR
jgi:hypothetical protein